MGQAKQRGSYEQRKAEGELRVAREYIERQEELKRIAYSLSPVEKEKRRNARKFLAMAYGLGIRK